MLGSLMGTRWNKHKHLDKATVLIVLILPINDNGRAVQLAK